MNQRFTYYLRFKKISQRKVSELSCVPESTVSRFCAGGSISSDKLLRLLQVCDDLSLDWFFYGTGEMIRTCGNVSTMNIGTFAGADIVSDDGVLVKDSKGVSVVSKDSKVYLSLLAEKDRLLATKDKVISQRDETIKGLYELLSKYSSNRP